VLPQGNSLAELDAAMAEAPAIDLVVGVNLNNDRGGALLSDSRGMPKTAATPLLLVSQADVSIDQARRYVNDRSIAVRALGASDSALSETVKDLIAENSGGSITADEATAYATRSLNALRELAISNNPVLRVGDASTTLIAALTDKEVAHRMEIADVLSRIPQERSQRAVMEAALTAEGEERVTLLNAVASSAKRFGSFLEERQVARLSEIARTASEKEATAAASLMGALNLPNDQMLPLILGSEVAQK
jgi:hypothetical protein